MLKTVAVVAAVIVALVGIVLISAAFKPNDFRVQRSTSIKAPPEKVFPLINDFHTWGSWSPYEKLDPAMKRTYTGAADGKGAVYAWESNGNAGAGRMEITESSPNSRIKIKLDFSKPFKANNVAEFTLEDKGGSTDLTWAMYGPNPYIAKLMGIFFDMDSLVGKDFETGLANLKAAAEK